MRAIPSILTVLAIALPVAFAAPAEADGISPKAASNVAILQSLDVEHRWIAGHHVDWMTGLPDDSSEVLPGRHTHCSAFVAAAAMRFGIYILRPPQHGQVLLANAQHDWLGSAGAAQGWSRVETPVEAQSLANQGELVVASYRSHRDNTPGHIAIVLPGAKSAEQIEADGPDVMQAGTVNAVSTPLATGFAGHPHAWGDREVAFFAHATP
jgi:hypothetical protein